MLWNEAVAQQIRGYCGDPVKHVVLYRWAPLAYRGTVVEIPVVVVELPLFLRQARAIWDDAEQAEFVDFVARNPESGDVIPETGGIRKVRWRRQGRGKRGGARVIYFFHDLQMPLFLILVYAKTQRENMTTDEKKQVRELAIFLKRQHGR